MEKRGLPFILVRFKKEECLLLVICFLIIIYGLSSFILSIEIEGAVRISEEKLLQNLAKHGIRHGAYKRNLDTSSIANKVVIDMPELWWVSIQLKEPTLVRVAETRIRLL